MPFHILQTQEYRRSFFTAMGAALGMPSWAAARSACAHLDIRIGAMIITLSIAFGVAWLLIEVISQRVIRCWQQAAATITTAQ